MSSSQVDYNIKTVTGKDGVPFYVLEVVVKNSHGQVAYTFDEVLNNHLMCFAQQVGGHWWEKSPMDNLSDYEKDMFRAAGFMCGACGEEVGMFVPLQRGGAKSTRSHDAAVKSFMVASTLARAHSVSHREFLAQITDIYNEQRQRFTVGLHSKLLCVACALMNSAEETKGGNYSTFVQDGVWCASPIVAALTMLQLLVKPNCKVYVPLINHGMIAWGRKPGHPPLELMSCRALLLALRKALNVVVPGPMGVSTVWDFYSAHVLRCLMDLFQHPDIATYELQAYLVLQMVQYTGAFTFTSLEKQQALADDWHRFLTMCNSLKNAGWGMREILNFPSVPVMPPRVKLRCAYPVIEEGREQQRGQVLGPNRTLSENVGRKPVPIRENGLPRMTRRVQDMLGELVDQLPPDGTGTPIHAIALGQDDEDDGSV